MIAAICGTLPNMWSNPVHTSTSTSTADEDVVRPELEDAIQDLSDDAERLGGPLERSRLDDYYVTRGLSPEDAAIVEAALRQKGVEIDERPPTHGTTFANVHGTALEALLATARGIPWLSIEEERSCGQDIRRHLEYVAEADGTSALAVNLEAASRAAQERLVTSNIFAVAKVANDRRYLHLMPVEDLVQEGLIGLMTAAKRFDPTIGARFSTYAHYWVRQQIDRAIDNGGRTIRLPTHMAQSISVYLRTRRRCGFYGDYRPSEIPIIAERLGWPLERTMRIALLAEVRPVPIDAPLKDGERGTIGDTIPCNAATPAEIVASEDLRRVIRELVESLEDARLRDIVQRRFGLVAGDEGQTLEEIGALYGVTRERIRQLEAKALGHLRTKAKRLRLEKLGDW